MKNTSSIVWGSLIFAVVLLVGLVMFAGGKDPVPVNLPLKVDEFSDFQCPACASFSPTAMLIREMEDVDFTFRHFPLEQIHDRAYAAAVVKLVAPGPSVEIHTPVFPVSLPYVAAIKPAPCS